MDINKARAIIEEDDNKPVQGDSSWITAIQKLAQKDIQLFKGGGDKRKERFFSETAMLLGAGVDLHSVLVLSADTHSKAAKDALMYTQLTDKVLSGMSLSDAMLGTGRFSPFDCYSVQIGESTGELALVFSKLADYYTKKIAQRRKIVSSLAYPAIVLLTTIGAVFFMLKFVVPMFAQTLVQFGGELPAITRWVIFLSGHAGGYLTVTVSIALLLFILYRYNKHKHYVRAFTSALMLRLPYFGNVMRKTYLLRFTQSMELLLAAHVDLVESIDLTGKMIAFYPLEHALQQVKNDVISGSFLYEAMSKHTFFDRQMIMLVKIGEEVNQLDTVFAQMNQRYENELAYHTNILTTLLEPVMILLLALIIGTILIAMYLPMFRIGTVIK